MNQLEASDLALLFLKTLCNAMGLNVCLSSEVFKMAKETVKAMVSVQTCSI